jgi:hypothetical protein
MSRFAGRGQCAGYLPEIGFVPTFVPRISNPCAGGDHHARWRDVAPAIPGRSRRVALTGCKPFAHAIDEFLEEFYLHPATRQTRIDAAPMSTGDALQNAYPVRSASIARRGLSVPDGSTGRSTSGSRRRLLPAVARAAGAPIIRGPDRVPTLAPVHDAAAAAARGFLVVHA